VCTGRFGDHDGHFDPGQRLANIAMVATLVTLLLSGLGMILLPRPAAVHRAPLGGAPRDPGHRRAHRRRSGRAARVPRGVAIDAPGRQAARRRCPTNLAGLARRKPEPP
jgi:hypothetical protein